MVERYGVARLRNERFFSPIELNAAIRQIVADLNAKIMADALRRGLKQRGRAIPSCFPEARWRDRICRAYVLTTHLPTTASTPAAM